MKIQNLKADVCFSSNPCPAEGQVVGESEVWLQGERRSCLPFENQLLNRNLLGFWVLLSMEEKLSWVTSSTLINFHFLTFSPTKIGWRTGVPEMCFKIAFCFESLSTFGPAYIGSRADAYLSQEAMKVRRLWREPCHKWKMGGSGNVLCRHQPPHISSSFCKSISEKMDGRSPLCTTSESTHRAQRGFKCWPWWETFQPARLWSRSSSVWFPCPA